MPALWSLRSAPAMAPSSSAPRRSERRTAAASAARAAASLSTTTPMTTATNASSIAWRAPPPSPSFAASRSASLRPPNGLGSEAGDDAYITSEKDFEDARASADVVVVDFMARWCRKCIYVKPRIATLLKDKFPQVPLAFVDVNAVPAGVVSGAGVTKMPTVVLYVRGEIAESYVAGESATAAVLRVEEMVKRGLEQAKKEKKGKKEEEKAEA